MLILWYNFHIKISSAEPHLQLLEKLLAGLLAGDLCLVEVFVTLHTLPVPVNAFPRPHVETWLHVHFQDAGGHVLPPEIQEHRNTMSAAQSPKRAVETKWSKVMRSCGLKFSDHMRAFLWTWTAGLYFLYGRFRDIISTEPSSSKMLIYWRDRKSVITN